MIRTQNHLVRKRTLSHLAKPAKWLNCVVSTYLYSPFDCKLLSRTNFRVNLHFTSFRVNLHSIVCLNVKERLVQSRHHIWRLSDSNVIRTHNHLVRKRTLNHLTKLAKWLSCVVSTYLYSPFDSLCVCVYVCVCVCVFISFHLRGFSWLKQNNKCNARDQGSDVVLRKSLCVKYIHHHI